MSASELVDIVDEDNNVIDTVTRAKMRKDQLPHRASYIAVMDHRGKFLVEIRTLCKDYSPGTFDAVVGGVMQHGEDYVESAKRELFEEIGVDANSKNCKFFNFGPHKIISKSGMRFFYGYLYLAVTDSITVRQKSEVSGILYLSAEDLLLLADSTAYDSVVAFKEILRRAQEQGILK